MFKEIRKKSREIPTDEAIGLLKDGEYGVLATIGENGYPYAVPLSYVYHDGAIYFHCAVEGNKLDNIRNCEKVSFCTIGKTNVLSDEFSTEYESAIVYGKAFILDEEEEKRKGLLLIAEKYSPEFIPGAIEYINRAINATRIVKIEIDRVTGKARR